MTEELKQTIRQRVRSVTEEQVAVRIKKVWRMLGGLAPELEPDRTPSHQEFLGMARDLLTSRTLRREGRCQGVRAEELDARVDALEHSDPKVAETIRAMKRVAGLTRLCDILPTCRQIDEVADVLHQGVAENTGGIGGASFWNWLKGLGRWFMNLLNCAFGRGGYKCLKQCIAEVTAESIQHEVTRGMLAVRSRQNQSFASNQNIRAISHEAANAAMKEAGFTPIFPVATTESLASARMNDMGSDLLILVRQRAHHMAYEAVKAGIDTAIREGIESEHEVLSNKGQRTLSQNAKLSLFSLLKGPSNIREMEEGGIKKLTRRVAHASLMKLNYLPSDAEKEKIARILADRISAIVSDPGYRRDGIALADMGADTRAETLAGEATEALRQSRDGLPWLGTRLRDWGSDDPVRRTAARELLAGIHRSLVEANRSQAQVLDLFLPFIRVSARLQSDSVPAVRRGGPKYAVGSADQGEENPPSTPTGVGPFPASLAGRQGPRP